MGLAALVCAGPAIADSGLNWKNSSDMLAIGLPLLAAGSAWGQGDTEGFKQLTLSMATTVGTAEVLKRSVHSVRPDGSDNKSFPSTHTAWLLRQRASWTSATASRWGLTPLGCMWLRA